MKDNLLLQMRISKLQKMSRIKQGPRLSSETQTTQMGQKVIPDHIIFTQKFLLFFSTRQVNTHYVADLEQI